MTSARIAAAIDNSRKARGLSMRALGRASGWDKQCLVVALRGGAVSLPAMDAMATVVGLRLTIESADELLPLSFNELREATR